MENIIRNEKQSIGKVLIKLDYQKLISYEQHLTVASSVFCRNISEIKLFQFCSTMMIIRIQGIAL